MLSDWTSQGEADEITRKFVEISEHRAAIEQAKGVLMAVHDIDEDSAFDLLKWSPKW